MNKAPIRAFGFLLAAMSAVCAYPALYVYFHNIEEAVLTQVFPPIFIFFAVGLVSWMAFRLLSGSLAKGLFVTLVFLFVFMNYSQIEAGIRLNVPDWRWWHIMPTFIFLLINLALALRIWAARPGADAVFFKLSMAVGFLYLALIVCSAAQGIRVLARMPRAEQPSREGGGLRAEDVPAMDSTHQKPNFYFFIFDEYARQDVLMKYTGYDNNPFLHGLQAKGFNVSYSSYSSGRCTIISLANVLHYSSKYNQVIGIPSEFKRPPLFVGVKRGGYRTYTKLHLFQRIANNLTDVVLETQTGLTALSVSKTVMEASFMAYLKPANHKAQREDTLNLFQQASDIVKEKSEKPKFLLLHLMVPHHPFIFDENGGTVAFENSVNWADGKYYAEQLCFTSKKIDELVDTILQNDPGAIVLLQSDHGPRYFSGILEEERTACLNVLYLSGQSVDIEGLSSINTLRLALNHALGIQLEMEGIEP